MRRYRNPPPPPRRVRRLNKTRKTISRTWRTMRWLRRHGWAHRRKLGPVYGVAGLYTLAAYAHTRPDGVRSVAWLSGIALGLTLAWHAWASQQPRTRRHLNPMEQYYTLAMFGLGVPWLLWATADGVMPPRLGFLILPILPAAWIPALIRYRIRPTPIVMAPLLAPLQQLWADHAAIPAGLAPGSAMYTPRPMDPEDPELALVARVELARTTKITAASVAADPEKIGIALDVVTENIHITRPADLPARFLDLVVFSRNPLRDNVTWQGPEWAFNPETGQMKFSRIATGGYTEYSYWGPSGLVHDLIAGATGSGKSDGLNRLLAVERRFPHLFASVVLDPQVGQSLPRWVGQTALYGKGIEENRYILGALVDEMYDRNKILSQVVYQETGYDDDGTEVLRDVTGVNTFNPLDPVIQQLGMKVIVVTIDEAAAQLADKESLDYITALSTMARKCGIKIRLVFQNPGLEQVKSSTLRQQLGNIIVYRLGDAVSGSIAMAGRLPVAPHLIPVDLPGACYVLSGTNPTTVLSRTELIRDVWALSHWGETVMLPTVEAFLDRIVADLGDEGAATATAPVAGVAAPRPSVAATGKRDTYPARIVAYLTEHGMATTSEIAAALLGRNEQGQIPKLGAISQACHRLLKARAIEQAVEGGSGLWRIPSAQVKEIEDEDVA